MIVNYDKETDMVYISKQIDDRWIQVGLNRDEVNQIVRSNIYNPQAERERVLALITENNRVLKIALERVESLTERAIKPVYNHGQFAALINSVIEGNEAELRQSKDGEL